MSELEKFELLLKLLSPEQVHQLSLELPRLLTKAGMHLVKNSNADLVSKTLIRTFQMLPGGQAPAR